MQTEDDKVNFTLFVTEKFSLSDEAYHELTAIHSSLPRLHKLRDAKKTLDSKSQISITPGCTGVQQRLCDCL